MTVRAPGIDLVLTVALAREIPIRWLRDRGVQVGEVKDLAASGPERGARDNAGVLVAITSASSAAAVGAGSRSPPCDGALVVDVGGGVVGSGVGEQAAAPATSSTSTAVAPSTRARSGFLPIIVSLDLHSV